MFREFEDSRDTVRLYKWLINHPMKDEVQWIKEAIPVVKKKMEEQRQEKRWLKVRG